MDSAGQATPESQADELIKTCTFLLDHPNKAQRDSSKLAGLLMIVHLPEPLVLRLIKDRALAESIWVLLAKDNFLARVLLTPVKGTDSNASIYISAALRTLSLFSEHAGFLESSNRVFAEWQSVCIQRFLAVRATDPEASKAFYEGLQDILQTLSNLLRDHNRARELVRTPSFTTLFFALLQSFVADVSHEDFGVKEIQLANVVVEQMLESEESLKRLQDCTKDPTGASAVSALLGRASQLLTDHLQSPYTFLLLRICRSLFIAMEPEVASKLSLPFVGVFQSTLLKVLSSKLDSASRLAVFRFAEALVFVHGVTSLILSKGSDEKHKLLELALRLASVELSIGFSEYIQITDSDSEQSTRLKAEDSSLPEAVIERESQRKATIETCSAFATKVVEFLSEQAESLAATSKKLACGLKSTQVESLFKLLHQVFTYALEYLDSLAEDLVTEQWPPQGVVSAVLGIIGAWLLEGGGLDSKSEKLLASTGTLKTLTKLIKLRPLSVGDSVLSVFVMQEGLRVKLAESPAIFAEIFVTVLRRNTQPSGDEPSVNLGFELAAEILTTENFVDSPFVSELADAGLSSRAAFDSLLGPHLQVRHSGGSPEAIWTAVVCSVELVALISIGNEPLPKSDFTSRASLIKEILTNNATTTMLKDSGKLLQKQAKSALDVLEHASTVALK